MAQSPSMARPQLSPGVYWPKDRSTTTADGASIRWTTLPERAGNGRPTVALLSGFLCADTWWHDMAPALADAGYRVVLLHYRGIATSGLPRTGVDPGGLSVERFAEDVLDVLHAAGIDEVSLVGHSMGGQVMVEVARRIPARVRSMVGVTAADRSPFRDLYGAGWLAHPMVSTVLRALHLLREPMGTAVYRTVWRTLPFLPLARASTAFGPLTPADVLQSYSDHAAQLSGDYFTAVLRAMHRHDPGDLLSELDHPTLLVAGSDDPFTPLRTAKRMSTQLARSELFVVPDTTHAAILEASTEVNRAVLRHLQRHHPADPRS